MQTLSADYAEGCYVVHRLLVGHIKVQTGK